jgi:hypothetical protein
VLKATGTGTYLNIVLLLRLLKNIFSGQYSFFKNKLKIILMLLFCISVEDQ